jgi:hypothetical protein
MIRIFCGAGVRIQAGLFCSQVGHDKMLWFQILYGRSDSVQFI